MSMTRGEYPIPNNLNLIIAVLQLAVLLFLFYLCSKVQSALGLSLLALTYGVTMNSAYAMLHEAEHRLFHENWLINEIAGIVLSLFFPMCFHLLRQGHLGHHMRNRSDDEVFDLYFEEDTVVWKYLQLYGILTGLFWIAIVLGNFLALIYPQALRAKVGFDRPTQAFFDSVNPRYFGLIRFEAILVFVLHITLIYCFSIPLINYCLMLFGFGFMWSAMQYVHHYGTTRDVSLGAKNLRTISWLDAIWLNHNWHLVHHARPTIPWIYLPSVTPKEQPERENLLKAYLRMWKGPRLTTERIDNLYAGKIIK